MIWVQRYLNLEMSMSLQKNGCGKDMVVEEILCMAVDGLRRDKK